MDKIDLHGRYCDLVKAYEALVKRSADEKRALEQQLRYLFKPFFRCGERIPENILNRSLTTANLRESQHHPRPLNDPVLITELESKCKALLDQQTALREQMAQLEASLTEQKKINADLNSDLMIAISEGIKYRDSLKKMVEIREMEDKRILARK